MKNSNELINDLRDSGAITEVGRLTLLRAILVEKMEIEKLHFEEVKDTFRKIKEGIK
jgi:hypothetical protein